MPKLHDILPGVFGNRKGIWIKFEEIGYESILTGGMPTVSLIKSGLKIPGNYRYIKEDFSWRRKNMQKPDWVYSAGCHR